MNSIFVSKEIHTAWEALDAARKNKEAADAKIKTLQQEVDSLNVRLERGAALSTDTEERWEYSVMMGTAS